MPFLKLHPHVPQPLRVQRYRSSTALSAMAKAHEDMTFEDLEAVCAGYCCRALTPFVSGALPLGSWSHVNFPMADIEEQATLLCITEEVHTLVSRITIFSEA